MRKAFRTLHESADAARLATWYREVLGIDMDAHPNGKDYYRIFPTRDRQLSVVRCPGPAIRT